MKLDAQNAEVLRELPLGPTFQTMSGELDGLDMQACCSTVTSCSKHYDGYGHVSAVEFTMSVAVPYMDAAIVLDPQSWDEPEGSWFETIDYLGTTCPPNAGPADPVPPPGTGWSGSVLEDFRYDCAGGSAGCLAYRNHLFFQSRLDQIQQTFALTYELCPDGSLGAVGNGQTMGPGGLLLDCGYSAAAAGTDATMVSGAKVLQYSDQYCDIIGCDELLLRLSQRVLVEATAAALCRAESARPGQCQDFDCRGTIDNLNALCPENP